MALDNLDNSLLKVLPSMENVMAMSKSDYAVLVKEMGVKFMHMSDMEWLVANKDFDVIVLAVSIISFENPVEQLVPHQTKRMDKRGDNSCPLIANVLSIKEHPRHVLLELLQEECYILPTHPMFGPVSEKDGWEGQTFVYEKMRIINLLLYHAGNKNNGVEDHAEDFFILMMMGFHT